MEDSNFLSSGQSTHRSRSSSHSIFLTESLASNNRARSISHSEGTGDTFTLLKDAQRLQMHLESTIGSFILSKGLCKELSAQIVLCHSFVDELILNYDFYKPYLESKQYFVAFMEYIEVLNKTSEFIFLLKDKGALTRLKNRERYRRATRVLALEVGKAVHHLQRKFAERTTKGPQHFTESVNDDSIRKNMITISGTLKLLKTQIFPDNDNQVILAQAKEVNEPKLTSQRIQRRQIRRELDLHPRQGTGYIVYKAIYNGNEVAEKVYKDIDVPLLKSIQQEIAKWVQLRSNSHVAWIHGVWLEGTSLGIISDFFENGNLHQLIAAHLEKGTEIDLLTKMRLSYDLIEAVSSLHSEGVIHGCITLKSLFLTQMSTLQFAGFETIVQRIKGDSKEDYIPYTPPEILVPSKSGSTAISFRGDIYSLGVTLGSIWCTRLPYSGAENIKGYFSNGGMPLWINDIPPTLQPLIMACLETDPSMRPIASQLLKDMRAVMSSRQDSDGLLTIDIPQSPTKETSFSGDISIGTITNDYSFNVSRKNSVTSPKFHKMDSLKNFIMSTPYGTEAHISPPMSPFLETDYPEALTNSSFDSYPSTTGLSTTTSAISGSTNSGSIEEESLGITLNEALEFHNNQQYQKAFAYFSYLSGIENLAAANYYLGVYHYLGKPGFLPSNVPLALEFLEKAAKTDHGDALDLLGLHYLDPAYGTRDYNKAFEYFQKAASFLSPPGCYHLSQCYKHGQGTKQDLDLSLYSLELAANLGYRPAIAMLEQERSTNSL